jgi:hypothetical protein
VLDITNKQYLDFLVAQHDLRRMSNLPPAISLEELEDALKLWKADPDGKIFDGYKPGAA